MTARSAREQILGDIARALRPDDKKDAGRRLDAVVSDPKQLENLAAKIRMDNQQRRSALIEQFVSEVTRIGGRLHRAMNVESALQYIEQTSEACGAKRIVAWEAGVTGDIGLGQKLQGQGIEFLTETSGPEFIRLAGDAEIGVSGVDYGLADTGTLVLLARKGQARSISLLPPVHIAIIRPEQIISGLSDLFPLIRSQAAGEGRDLSSAITLITGPSRTADIELTLVVGVHGPQQLHVLLLE